MFTAPPVFLLSCLGPILFGIAVLVAVRLLSDPAAASDDALYFALGVVGWVLIVIGFLVLCVALLGPVFGVLGLIVLVMVYFRHRAAQQHALLWSLTVAAERMMPLGPAVEAFASERPWGLDWQARRLAQMLDDGVALPDALGRCWGLVPRHALLMIRVGTTSGTLARALRQVVTLRESREPLWTRILGKLLYLTILTLVAIFVITFISLKLLPSFCKIFQEFEAELPAVTQWVIAVTGLFAEYWFLLALPTFLVFLGLLIYLVLGYIGLFDFGIPGLDRIEQAMLGPLGRRLDSATIFEALALIARQQRPLPEGIEILARWYPKSSIRLRLVRALEKLKAGGDWCASLAAQGLMTRADRAVLQAAQRVGNLPWALREMADSTRRRLAYRLQVLLEILFPLVIGLYALTLGVIVVGYFLPLVTLIQHCVAF